MSIENKEDVNNLDTEMQHLQLSNNPNNIICLVTKDNNNGLLFKQNWIDEFSNNKNVTDNVINGLNDFTLITFMSPAGGNKNSNFNIVTIGITKNDSIILIKFDSLPSSTIVLQAPFIENYFNSIKNRTILNKFKHVLFIETDDNVTYLTYEQLVIACSPNIISFSVDNIKYHSEHIAIVQQSIVDFFEMKVWIFNDSICSIKMKNKLVEQLIKFKFRSFGNDLVYEFCIVCFLGRVYIKETEIEARMMIDNI